MAHHPNTDYHACAIMVSDLYSGKRIDFVCVFGCSVYRATFPLTFNEIRNYGKGEGWKVFFGVTVGITISVFLASFLRRTGQLFISAKTIIEGCVQQV